MKRGYKPYGNLGQDIQGEESISAKALGPWTYFENRINRIAFFFFFFLAEPHGMQDLSSRD